MCYNGQEDNDFIRTLILLLSLKTFRSSMLNLGVNFSMKSRQGLPMIFQHLRSSLIPIYLPICKELVEKTPSRGKSFIISLLEMATDGNRYHSSPTKRGKRGLLDWWTEKLPQRGESQLSLCNKTWCVLENRVSQNLDLSHNRSPEGLLLSPTPELLNQRFWREFQVILKAVQRLRMLQEIEPIKHSLATESVTYASPVFIVVGNF